ncbi:Metal tolerance protein C4 [Platanthera guangdongensis]|uniref:Metal tolerance protein C4 n=1 Tax=Platanthera guangdongensis TaxID=2320717 RepID=A0ABR2MMH7_9ASPA
MQGSGGRRLLHISCCVIKSRSTIYYKESLSPFFLLHNSPLHNSSSFYSNPEKDSPPVFFRRCPSWTPPSPLAVFSRVSLQNQSPSSSAVGAGSRSTLFISFVRNYSLRVAKINKATNFDDTRRSHSDCGHESSHVHLNCLLDVSHGLHIRNTSQQAVTTALWCNFLVFSLKFGVWLATSSHVMLAEVVHSVADFANQALLAYGLNSSKRAPDALHPYGYSKERFVWSLISAVGIFCLGSGATIVNGIQNLSAAHHPENIQYAAIVIGGSFILEGASLLVAVRAVKKGAAAEGMTVRDYVWRGHDPTSVAVMTEVRLHCKFDR